MVSLFPRIKNLLRDRFGSLAKVCVTQRLIWTLLALKALYLVALVSAILLWDAFDREEFNAVLMRWPREGEPVFASHFATWDAAHYLFLSEVGYARDLPSCAFCPLWPLLVRTFAGLFGASQLLTGLLLANASSLAAWTLFFRLMLRRIPSQAAGWGLIFLVAFPGSLFFQFHYTESLFLLLVLVLWWSLENERNGWTFVAATLMPLTRPIGVFAMVLIGWYVIRRMEARSPVPPLRSALQPRSYVSRTARSRMTDWPGALLGVVARRGWLLAAPLLGWSIDLAFMWHCTGNPFEGIAAQRYWGVHYTSNLWNVPKFIIGFFTPTEWHAFRGSLLDRLSFVLLLYSLPVVLRLDKDLMVWIYVLGILPAMSGTFTSYTRFASCAFPMFIALGVFLGRPERRFLRWATVWVFATLHAVLLWRFVNFRWAG